MYSKWKKEKFSDNIFNSPTAEFRGAPFWAWNSALDTDMLRRQVDIFAEMGFGGFNMHVRQGLATEYLGDDFMNAVSACIDQAEKNNIFAWLYDEDRWPSGCAGGFVTKEIRYRAKGLLMTCKKRDNAVYKYEDAVENGRPVFLAAFSLNVDENGFLTSYSRISENDECENKRYFYCITARGGEPRYNYQSYVDVLSKPAIDRFIELTHERFRKNIGDKFGNTVPAIFTDEPQVQYCKNLNSGHSKGDVSSAWTWDFADTFKSACGFDIIEKLPEIFFRKSNEENTSVRYYYYRHVSERFCEAFLDNIGDWCEKNNIMLTGHMMCEDSLKDITRICTDPMRGYVSMQLPGIDVLKDKRLFTTAKQCDSIVRQMGKAGMISELYGVTNWDYDFRGHKSQGDWQACLGVNVRVPHLSWQTMKGEGKRDYPASIFYQSPWYKQYKIIEDHYARLNTALTRGKAVADIAVLHPIETYWTKYCSEAESGNDCAELDKNFSEVCEWLLRNSVSFDYISESTLPILTNTISSPLRVGAMEYSTIIVDSCENLRPYTIEVLREFAKEGGRLILSGNLPHISCGIESEEAKALRSFASDVIPHSKQKLIGAIADTRDVLIENSDGTATEDFLYTRRREGNTDWLFIAQANAPELWHIPAKRKIRITVNGMYKPTLYDTVSGNISDIPYRSREGRTEIFYDMFDFDSLLIKLDVQDTPSEYIPGDVEIVRYDLDMPYAVDYRLEEPNVLVLDMAEWSLDGSDLNRKEEILRIDETVRKRLGLTARAVKTVQPWAVAKEPEDHKLYLKFTFRSEIECDNVKLAIENLHSAEIKFNGKNISTEQNGYYVDWEIPTCALGTVEKGENVIEISIPFGVRTDIENCFVIGEFGVSTRGREARITALPEDIVYGNAATQGLAFYGGNLIYNTEVSLDESSALEFEISYYKGALVRVMVDGEEMGYIWKSPFRLITPELGAGEHKISYTVYGNRFNTFSALHSLVSDKKEIYTGPMYWHSTGFEWSYEYNLRPFGIIKAPIVRKYKEIKK